MANAHGRNPEPGYFQSIPEDTNRDSSAEPRRDNPSERRASPTQKRSSPPINNEMASSVDRDELKLHPVVSPELIAEITERVKKEGMYHRLRGPRALLTRGT
jgi:hypothetical protein